MTDIMAAIGLAQMYRYEGILERRKEIIGRYDVAFRKLGVGVCRITRIIIVLRTSLYHQSSGNWTKQRQEIIVKMAEAGIATNVHYKPLPMMTAYKKLGFDIKDYPNAYKQFKNEITLPLHTKLTDVEVEYVIGRYCEIVGEYV